MPSRRPSPGVVITARLDPVFTIAETGVRKGSTLAYVFDYGDEWRLLVKVVDAWEPDNESYPMLVEAEGVAPPQYLDPDEGDA